MAWDSVAISGVLRLSGKAIGHCKRRLSIVRGLISNIIDKWWFIHGWWVARGLYYLAIWLTCGWTLRIPFSTRKTERMTHALGRLLKWGWMDTDNLRLPERIQDRNNSWFWRMIREDWGTRIFKHSEWLYGCRCRQQNRFSDSAGLSWLTPISLLSGFAKRVTIRGLTLVFNRSGDQNLVATWFTIYYGFL